MKGKNHLRNLISIIHCLELVSKMKINWQKSFIVGLNSFPLDHLDISKALGYSLFFYRLSWSSFKRQQSKELLASRYRKMSKHLENKLPIFGGRIILIKAALSNLPINFLSHFYYTKMNSTRT